MLFKGCEEDVAKLYEFLRNFYGVDVYGYKVSGNTIVFNVIEKVDEIPVNNFVTQKPGYYRLFKGFGFTHSFQSPKNFLYPPIQEVALVFEDLSVEIPKNIGRNVVLFGIKPCDLAAINVFDELFALNFNPYYLERRRKVFAIIVEECLYPSETCFCGSLGFGPVVENGFDIAYARVGRGSVIFKAGSSIGKTILNNLGIAKASESDVELYRKLVEDAKKKTDIGVAVEVVQKALAASMADKDLWEKLSEKCLGCSNCNMVCPTCFCVEIIDELENGKSKRVSHWVGCLSYTYGLVAGGHFRKELYTRYRHFILHKFLFYPKQVGMLGCTGCGRCVAWCPVGIDIRETLKTVVKIYGGR